MKNPIAFCGLDCSACPAYIATQADDQEGLRRTAESWSQGLGIPIKPEDCICDGCQPQEGARVGGYLNECPMRACAMERTYPNCAHCPDYACENLAKFWGQSTESKAKLDSIRERLQQGKT